ncbi:MAG: imidazole glycerol phosphate synthase subunit HisH [Deltaproteobacteria bacterium]|jgi:glutamine amidotransferase|nr:imidazole glycerol phosphate synthase subunit HisH [Deltaproteobacteria bacterium]
MLAIIDYQAGNQTSVHRALDHLGLESVITDNPETLHQANGLIFPGVGAAGQAMGILKNRRLDLVIAELIKAGRPFLGICLGCQIMLEFSEENQTQTLGILPGHNIRFAEGQLDEDGRPIRIPHMGWNTVNLVSPTALWNGLSPEDQFYFVHSYHPVPGPGLTLGLTRHGLEFASVFGREGLWALQFHPEKSGRPGLRILSNFHRYCLEAARAK